MQAAKICFVEPDYYIHGTDAPHTLGEAASHGCLRMAPADVERPARQVQEHGGERRPGRTAGASFGYPSTVSRPRSMLMPHVNS